MTSVPFDDERPPRPGRRIVVRAAIAAVLIVVGVGAAVASIGLLQLGEVTKVLHKAQAESGNESVHLPSVTVAEAGKPQTIMILGTDERKGADKSTLKDSRSDTIILARLNAKRSAISLMSIPRDFKVDLPGYGINKLNAAFTFGGAELTAKTVKSLLSAPGKPFKINHVVQISFTGFRELVNFLGCSWVDVDRHYFNNQGGVGGYAVIDIQAGYQKLCGTDALSYVRYRHTDNDLVRAARQQDFVRQLLRQPGVRRRLSYSQRLKLTRIAGRFTRTDDALDSNKGIFTLLKLGLAVADKPVVQVPFGAGRIEDDTPEYLTASEDAIRETVRQFMNPKVETGKTASPAKARRSTSRSTSRASRKRRKRRADAWKRTASMQDVSAYGENEAIAQARKLRFPFYYPTLIPSTGDFVGDGPRRYAIRAGKKVYRAYRTVIDVGGTGQFMGVQGMSWKNPPILQGPHDTITVDRRKLEVFWDGKNVRLVSWRTRRGVYWVSNTLTRTQPYSRMVATARSLRHLR